MTSGPARSARACSIREIRLLHREPDSGCPLPGDTVEVAGRVYLVVAEQGESAPGGDRGGYVHVRGLSID